MQRISPRVGVTLPVRRQSISPDTRLAIPLGSLTIHRRGTFPVERQTKMVSTIEEPVPLIWIEAPISAGHGNDAEHVNPASRIETAIG